MPISEIRAKNGLSSQEAHQRLVRDGPNALPEAHTNPWRDFVRKFWGPIPWMLEASIVLQLALGRVTDALITLALLVVNAVLSYAQESKAQNALTLLQNSLSIQARVLRDGKWRILSARELVSGDIIHLRVGDIVPADVKLIEGELSADQSSLTGESTPAEVGAGQITYAGSIIRRGEASCEITGTGQKTYFGKTAHLVETAKTESHLESVIQGVVKYLVILNAILAMAVLGYVLISGKPLSDFLPFILMLLVASIPVALPATFTLTAALGSQWLVRRGVLVTRLSAIEEAAAMDVLCSDKTGTLTENKVVLAAVKAIEPFSEDEVLRLAALASDEASQDGIDLAILNGARQRDIRLEGTIRTQFVPFDPATKRTEAEIRDGSRTLRIVKGFPNAISKLTHSDVSEEVELLAAQGYRVIALACHRDDGTGLHMAGLIGLQDPPRAESADVITRLRALGVRILMITGDGLATAKAVARQVGIGDRTCAAEMLQESNLDGAKLDCDLFAGVFPEDKFSLVRALQRSGHVVGMTGDGVNDSPALKQAEVGIAVANATDVAKAAASLVLTNPGLKDMLAAVEVGRSIYQRMQTYTLNKLVKTIQIGIFLSLGLFVLGELVTRPRLILLLLFANDL